MHDWSWILNSKLRLGLEKDLMVFSFYTLPHFWPETTQDLALTWSPLDLTVLVLTKLLHSYSYFTLSKKNYIYLSFLLQKKKMVHEKNMSRKARGLCLVFTWPQFTSSLHHGGEKNQDKNALRTQNISLYLSKWLTQTGSSDCHASHQEHSGAKVFQVLFL